MKDIVCHKLDKNSNIIQKDGLNPLLYIVSNNVKKLDTESDEIYFIENDNICKVISKRYSRYFEIDELEISTEGLNITTLITHRKKNFYIIYNTRNETKVYVDNKFKWASTSMFRIAEHIQRSMILSYAIGTLITALTIIFTFIACDLIYNCI